jgi:MoaD family protein
LVEVLYFAEFKSIANKEKEKFNFESIRLLDLINHIIQKYPKMRSLIFDEKTDGMSDEISIAINHNILKKEEKTSIELTETDVVAFLMPISGG